MEEIACIVHPLKLLCLEGEKNTGCGVIEVSFSTSSGAQVSEISFTNYYVASLSIRGQTTKKNQSKGKCRTVVKNMRLMESPHFANEAQNQFRVRLKDYISTEEDSFASLHFIVRQPSPRWQNFYLENIKLFNVKSDETLLSETSNADDVTSKSIKQHSPCIGSFNEHLKSMDDMFNINGMKLESNEPKPFEIGGCYDINLLSYGT